MQQRGVFFSDLSSEESRMLFKKFAKKWNSGALDKVCGDSMVLI
jgi:hypothetical protein